MNTKNFVSIVGFTFLSLVGVAQTPEGLLNKSLAKIYKKSNFPGFTISVVTEDSTLFSQSYGYADKKRRLAYDAGTIQPVGSVSKTFIALALMKAIELGYFTLETNINDLLPYPIINPYAPSENITVRQLATHTSSLLDNDSIYTNVAYQLSRIPTIALGNFLQDYYNVGGKYYSAQNFDSLKPGTRYAYSNIASALMAHIIEIKSNMPFDEFTQRYIFQPLKMTNTHWFYDKKFEKKYARLYQINRPETKLEETLLNADKSLKPYSCISYPDGSLKTSASDLTKYLKQMMKGYFSGDTAIIGSNSYQTLFEKQFSEKDMPLHMDKNEPNRAIFWSYSKKGVIRHTGSDPGVFAFISFDPLTRIGRVMMMNASLDGGDNEKAVGNFMKIIRALDGYEEEVEKKSP